MTETKPLSGTYLSLFDAAAFLAFNEPLAAAFLALSEVSAAVAQMLRSEDADHSMENTAAVFARAVKRLRTAAAMGSIRVWGRRPHQAAIVPIPAEYWINGIMEPAGEDGGAARPGNALTPDYDAETWIGLRFDKAEIHALGSGIEIAPDAVELCAVAARPELGGSPPRNGQGGNVPENRPEAIPPSPIDWRDKTRPTKDRIQAWLAATIAAGWDLEKGRWFDRCEDALNPDGDAPGFSRRTFDDVWREMATERMRRPGPKTNFWRPLNGR